MYRFETIKWVIEQAHKLRKVYAVSINDAIRLIQGFQYAYSFDKIVTHYFHNYYQIFPKNRQ